MLYEVITAAGVMVSKQSGDPEGATTIRIRGVGTINNSADPLYVVDGRNNFV